MVNFRLPRKRSKNMQKRKYLLLCKVPVQPRKKIRWIRYIIFAASLVFVASLFLAKVENPEGICV